MPKRSDIKWRKADQTKLSRTVGKFNAKRTRLIKIVPELEQFLPPKMNVQNLKTGISTRNDFNKTINRLERFLVKGAEDMVTTEGGVQTTKYQINELKIQQRTINQYRAKARKEANVSTEKGTMGAIKKMNLRPLTKNIEKTPKEMWDKLVNSYERQSMDTYYSSRDEMYKRNYLNAFKQTLANEIPDVYEKVSKMKAEDVVNMYYYDPNLQLDFFYPVEGENQTNMGRWYRDTFESYIKENNIEL